MGVDSVFSWQRLRSVQSRHATRGRKPLHRERSATDEQSVWEICAICGWVFLFLTGRLEMRRFITFVTTVCAILALFPLYSRFKVAAAPVPPGVHLGGLDLSNLKDPAEIRHHLDGLFSQTIVVKFADTQLPLRPQDVDFQIDGRSPRGLKT